MMKLENFDLDAPFGSVTLVGIGHHWDLHAWADFVGAEFMPEHDRLVLEWRAPDGQENPWGSPGNDSSGCRLVFNGVSFFQISPRDPAYPSSESRTVASISKASLSETKFRFQNSWDAGEPFRLLVEFQDERRIEVEAESVSLERLP